MTMFETSLSPALSIAAAAWLNALAVALVKSGLILIATCVLVSLLRRASAATRHLMWSLAFGSLLALPLLSALAPQWPAPRLLPGWPVEPLMIGPDGPAEQPDGAILGAPEPLVLNEPETGREREPVVLSQISNPSIASLWSTMARTPTATDSVVSAVSRWHWSVWIILVWALGVGVCVARLLMGLLAVRRLARRAAPIREAPWVDLKEELSRQLGLSARVRLVKSERVRVPWTWDLLRTVVFLPIEADQWSAARRRIVLLHELAHVKQRDCLMQMLAQLAAALYWLNPLVWVALGQLKKERELACDDRVLTTGTKASEYAAHLLDIARSLRPGQDLSLAAVALAHRSLLSRRLRAILNPRVSRRGVSRGKAILIGLMVGCVVSALAALQPIVQAEGRAVESVESSSPQASSAQISGPPAVKGPDVLVVNTTTDAPSPASDLPAHPAQDPSPQEKKDEHRGRLENPSVDDLIKIRRSGIDPEYIKRLRELGYTNLSVDDLLQLARYGVSADLIKEMKEIGFAELSIEDLSHLGRYGISPDYVRAIREMGYANLKVEEVVRLGKYGVRPDYLREMKELGLSDLPVEDVINLSKYGVSPDYVRRMRQAGYSNLSVEDWIKLMKYGVRPEFLKEMREAGFENLSIDDLVSLSKYGIEPTFIKQMSEAGYANLSVDELKNLKRYGVSAEFVKELKALGYDNLTVEDLIRLRKGGVDADFIRRLRRPERQ